MSVFAGGKTGAYFLAFFSFPLGGGAGRGGGGDNNGHVAVSRKECVVVRH